MYFAASHSICKCEISNKGLWFRNQNNTPILTFIAIERRYVALNPTLSLPTGQHFVLKSTFVSESLFVAHPWLTNGSAISFEFYPYLDTLFPNRCLDTLI